MSLVQSTTERNGHQDRNKQGWFCLDSGIVSLSREHDKTSKMKQEGKHTASSL